MVKLTDPLPDLEGEAKDLANRMTTKRGQLQGVYKVLFHNPELAARIAALGDLMRFEGILSYRQKEVVILAAARGLGSRFIWQQHEPPARKAGVPEATIEALRADELPSDEQDRLLSELCRSCLADQPLIQPLFDNLVHQVEERGVIEAVAIVGFYRMIQTVALSFEVALPREGERSF